MADVKCLEQLRFMFRVLFCPNNSQRLYDGYLVWWCSLLPALHFYTGSESPFLRFPVL